jgi:hypothetical protein
MQKYIVLQAIVLIDDSVLHRAHDPIKLEDDYFLCGKKQLQSATKILYTEGTILVNKDDEMMTVFDLKTGLPSEILSDSYPAYLIEDYVREISDEELV